MSMPFAAIATPAASAEAAHAASPPALFTPPSAAPEWARPSPTKPGPRRSPRRWWAATVASAVGAGLLAAVWAPEAARAWLGDALQAAAVHLGARSPLPNWGVYLLGGLGAAAAAVAAVGTRPRPRRAADRTDPQGLDEPHGQYRRDQFLGAQWEWQWDAQRRPTGLFAACPSCETRLVSYLAKAPGERRIKMFCEHCRVILVDEPGDLDYLHGRLARQIERKLRTGTWPSRSEGSWPGAAAASRDAAPLQRRSA